MLLFLQIVVDCGLVLAIVKCAVRNSGLNCLYFYPAEYIEEAEKRGIADKEATMKKGKKFMVPFCIFIFGILIPVIAFWNHVTDFKTAYIQVFLFLFVMNWFDGIVLDRIWVAHSKVWRIEGMEGGTYIKPWKYVLTRRSAGTVLYLVMALIIAGIVVLIGKI